MFDTLRKRETPLRQPQHSMSIATTLKMTLSLLSALTLISCQTGSKTLNSTANGLNLNGGNSSHANSQNANGNVSFEEFQKVLRPRSALLPLEGGKESLLLLAMPSDAYPKIYTLNHATQGLKPRFDAGTAINGLARDYQAKHLYVLIDNHGDENTRIFELDLKSNKLRPVFGAAGAKAQLQDFSADGETLFVLSNHENKSIYSLYKVDRGTGLGTRLTDGKTSFDGATVSEDGKTAALIQAFGNNEIRLWLLDMVDGRQTRVLSKKATIYSPAFFHPNNSELYLVSDDGRDRSACAKIDLKNPKRLIWVREDKTRDLDCSYSRVGKFSVVTENYDGRIALRVFEGVFGKEYQLPIPDRAVVSAVSAYPGDPRLYLRVSKADDPGDFFRIDLSQGANAKLEQVSKLNLSSLPTTQFAQSYDVKYKSFDGREIHGLMFAPASWLTDGKKRPVIVWPHGGPDSHNMHSYNPFFQFWAMNGYAVFAPNFRGSTGYGKKFETLNDRDWGGGHIKDLVWGNKVIAKLPYVDASRIFIVGASFGGYSTLSAITQYPKEFRGAVAIVALANLFTFYKSIPPDPAWQMEFRTEMGDPVKDAKLYRERSPYFYADKIKIPLKIYQAENDVRTVKAEMDEFVKKMNEAKLPVEYEVLLQEGHGLSRTESWQKVLQGTVDFLNKIQ